MLTGIDSYKEDDMSILPNFIIAGSLDSVNDGNNIVIGNWLASFLGVSLGDTITVTTTNIRTTLIGSFPRSINLTVSGIFELKAELDQSLVITSHQLAQIIDNKKDATQSIRVKVNDLFEAQAIANELAFNLTSEKQYFVGSSWKRTHGTLFRAVQMEKLITSLLLFLIVIVASFIILSTVIMTVKSKEREIGILKTIGASNKQLVLIFIFQGALISSIGIILGVVFGLIGTWNVANLVAFIESILQRNLLDQYFINYFPYSIDVGQILFICGVSFALSILATLVPAFKVSKLDPSEILRYE
jgi:lipoprotein-releasing system permease protein